MTTTVETFDAKAFRRALGSFPTGVAVITTLDAAGEPVGLTCNSFSSVSLDPPLVLWSLRVNSRSIDVFRGTKAFAINVLADDQDALSGRFASASKSMREKFEGVPFTQGHGGSPLLAECIARFECSAWAQHEAGDHVVFIGKVERFDETRDEPALVFYRGAYMMLTRSLRELATRGRVVPDELIRARSAVYGNLVRLACEAGTAEDFDAIERNLQQMDEHIANGDMLKRVHAAIAFFDLITRASHNEVLAVVAASLNSILQHAVSDQVAAAQLHSIYRPGLTPLRRNILARMRARDADGAAAAIAKYFDHVAASQPASPARAG